MIAHPAINGDFLDALVPKVKAIRTGDPSSPDTTMGTVIIDGGGASGSRSRSPRPRRPGRGSSPAASGTAP